MREWKKIEGTFYEVSNDGLVRSIERIALKSDGMKHPVASKILSPATDASGYHRVGIMIDGKLVTRKVHRLVAQAFLPIDNKRNEVNHKNGIKSCNNADNLEWVSRSENMLHAFKKGLATPLRGSKNPTAKIDEFQALTIITMLKSGFGPKKISEMYGISNHITKDISRGRTWQHLS